MTTHPPRILALFIILLFAACSKPNDNPTPGTPGTPGTPSRPDESTTADTLLSWELIGNTLNPTLLDIWFTSPSRGFTVGDGYIYQSSDSGITWTKIPGSYAQSGMENLFFVDNTYGFAQGVEALQVTKDGGNTWSTFPLPGKKGINVCFTTPSTGYYADFDAGLYRTVDSGKTWSPSIRRLKE